MPYLYKQSGSLELNKYCFDYITSIFMMHYLQLDNSDLVSSKWRLFLLQCRASNAPHVHFILNLAPTSKQTTNTVLSCPHSYLAMLFFIRIHPFQISFGYSTLFFFALFKMHALIQ